MSNFISYGSNDNEQPILYNVNLNDFLFKMVMLSLYITTVYSILILSEFVRILVITIYFSSELILINKHLRIHLEQCRFFLLYFSLSHI